MRAAAGAQIALLFLAHDGIPTEPIWAAFLTAAAEVRLRRAVLPPRPAAPRVIDLPPPPQEDVDATCWAHGGQAYKISNFAHAAYRGTMREDLLRPTVECGRVH